MLACMWQTVSQSCFGESKGGGRSGGEKSGSERQEKKEAKGGRTGVFTFTTSSEGLNS